MYEPCCNSMCKTLKFVAYVVVNCQRASRVKTVGLQGSQVNAMRSILNRAVKSVMEV